MFTMKNIGKPVAFVDGGKYDKKIVHLVTENEKCCNKCGNDEKKICCKKAYKCMQCNGNRKVDIKDDSIISALRGDLVNLANGVSPEIMLQSGEMRVLPNLDQRECLYIAGPSGSGKSTYASDYVKILKTLNPKLKLFVFSNVEKDKCLDKLKPIRVKLDDSFLEAEITNDMLKNSICVFDDCDYVKDKKVRDATTTLRDSLLGTGRHQNIYVVTTSHIINEGNKTRLSLAEASAITMFPNTDNYHIEQVLKAYCGFNRKMIQYVMKLPSRWITIHKRYPTYVIHQKGIFNPNMIKI